VEEKTYERIVQKKFVDHLSQTKDYQLRHSILLLSPQYY